MNKGLFSQQYITNHYEDYMHQINADKETAEEIAEALQKRKEHLDKIIVAAAKEKNAVNELIYSIREGTDMVEAWAKNTGCLLDVILDDEDLLFDCCSNEKRRQFEKVLSHLRKAELLVLQLQEEQ